MTALKRNVECKINRLLAIFPVVVILGTRQCGKTSLAKQLRPHWKYLDLESNKTYDQISQDLTFFFKENPRDLIIDEAQIYPEIFKELRGVIDSDRKLNGRFIITGSSSQELVQSISESLAGRVGIVELSPFKINELLRKPLSSFYQIFESSLNESTLEKLKLLVKISNHQEVKKHFFKGGYPDACLSEDDIVHSQWMENYFSTYINRDVRVLFPKLDVIKFRRFTQLLANISGQVINKSNLSRAIEVSDKTVKDYLDIADGTFIWRTIPSFENSLSKSIIKMPKGGFRDSGLLNFHRNFRTVEDLDSSPTIGHDFEHFVIEEIIQGINSTFTSNWQYYYYRTRGGAEVDLILSGAFGILPIEIKYGIKVGQRSLSSLKKFIEDYKLPFGIVVNNADDIEMLTSKIIQIPISYL